MTYDLNDPVADHGLELPGEVHVAPDADTLYDDLGLVFTSLALKADEERGAFHIALSGGTTPWPFYQRLLIDIRFRAVPWERTHIWIVDERRVPDDDDLNNFKSLTMRNTLTRRHTRKINSWGAFLESHIHDVYPILCFPDVRMLYVEHHVPGWGPLPFTEH